MAKTSSIEKYKRNVRDVARYKERYTKLKEIIKSATSSDEEKAEAQRKLWELPRTALPVRLRVRCQVTGRARGVYKKFKLNRHKFREFAHKGMLPGVAKASW